MTHDSRLPPSLRDLPAACPRCRAPLGKIVVFSAAMHEVDLADGAIRHLGGYVDPELSGRATPGPIMCACCHAPLPEACGRDLSDADAEALEGLVLAGPA